MSSILSRHVKACLLALQFLTVLPTPKFHSDEPGLQGLSLLWYPAVGLLLGLLLMLAATVVPLPFYLQAGLIVTLWIVLTGGLHLDGLADCADAWMGGLGDREKTLRLLKDPLCGSMGVIALISVIVLKCLALAAVIQSSQLHWLWLVPLLSRQSLLLLFLSTSYVRPEGLGELLAQYFSRGSAHLLSWGILIATLLILPLAIWITVWITLLTIFLIIRWAAMNRLGGFTGDVAGAQVELVEVGLLVVLACRSAV